MALYIRHRKKEIQDDDYDKWSPELQEFFDNAMPWVLMAVDVSFINEKTTGLINARLKLTDALWHQKLTKWAISKNFENLEDFLNKECCGFSGNIAFEDNRNFMNKLAKRLPRCTKRNFHDMEREFFKEECLEVGA